MKFNFKMQIYQSDAVGINIYKKIEVKALSQH